MRNIFYRGLVTRRLTKLLLPEGKFFAIRRFLILLILSLCLLNLPMSAYADLGDGITFIGTDTTHTRSIAWGDMDGDGDLDFAVGNVGNENDGEANQVYRNEGGGNFTLIWESNDALRTRSITWGDMDGDGDLDLAVGNYGQSNQVYRNEGSEDFTLAWSSSDNYLTYSVAWGDMDSDGKLDLAVGNWGANEVYRNEGSRNFTEQSIGDNRRSLSVVWGDYDEDGDIDLAVGNYGDVNQVYQNEGGDFTLAWQSTDSKSTQSIAWGDYDSDGDLDLAVGNSAAEEEEAETEVNQVYQNIGAGEFALAWESPLIRTKMTLSVAWGDYDSDGNLDLAVGNIPTHDPDCSCHLDDGQNQVYRNNGSGNFILAWESSDTEITTSVAWADYDSDGDLDLAAGNELWPLGQHNQVYHNNGGGALSLAWESTSDIKDTQSMAWGDMDLDGDLDLAVGNWNNQVNQVYRNEGDGSLTLAWKSRGDTKDTTSMVWGDMDSDGDLDLAMGNLNQVNQIYRNEGNADFTLAWESSGDAKSTFSVAWGDMDSDHDLDLVVGNRADVNQVYRNDGDAQFTLAWQSSDQKNSRSVAWGDYDSDGDLDIAVANQQDVNQVYRNEGNGNFTLAWQSTDQKSSYSVAWGDMDSDGDLDLAVGNWQSQANQVYQNNGGGDFTLHWESSGDTKDTLSLAWADYDSDGDLDLAFGNYEHVNQIYQNNGSGDFSLRWESTGDSKDTYSVAWGDIDNDGDVDLAVGNYGDVNQVFENIGPQETTLPNNPPYVTLTRPGSTADADFYASPTILTNKSIPITYTLFDRERESLGWFEAFYSMDGGGNWQPAIPTSNTITTNLATDLPPIPATTSVCSSPNLAIPDNNPTGVSDTIVVSPGGTISDLNISVNTLHTWVSDLIFTLKHVDTGTTVTLIDQPMMPVSPWGCSADNIVAVLDDEAALPIENECDPSDMPTIHGSFSPNNPLSAFDGEELSGTWMINVSDHEINDSGTLVEWCINHPNLAANQEPSGINTHTFTWDPFASGFFGQSDNVVLRFVAHPQRGSGMTDSYDYTNSVAGSYLWPSLSANTFPFRVRGTQVQVLSDTVPTANALVYRLPNGQSLGAELMGNGAGEPFHTDQQGYLQGRGQLNIGDQIVALLPITTTSNYTLYHTSASVTETGLAAHSVTTPGVQELVVSADNPLILFDLDVSLEWDARNDEAFLIQLEDDIQHTSQFLYDWTNGQVALGKVRIFHAKENWLDSHVIIPASNNRRPNADLGGIVTSAVSETLSSGQVITDAYLPGQVRMAPIWNRFGNPDDELGLDWPRTLAHELGHYLLFLPDNYLGSEDGHLIQVECSGSAMTDPYRDDYSEFLTPPEWTGDCLNTLAHQHLGRVDWETITTFYEMLNGSYENRNQGPGNLPLAVTQVTFIEPETPVNTLTDPFFYVTDEDGIQLPLPIGQAQVYLFKTQATEEMTDDVVIPIGSPFAEQVHARGAEPGDRLCVFDYSQSPRRLGCLEAITQGSTNLTLHDVPGWQPQITVKSVTSRTLTITVTQAISVGQELNVQVLPVAQPTTTVPIFSPSVTMIPIGSDTFTQTITLDHPQATGFVRVWVSDTLPLREEMSQFFFGGGWGPGSGSNGWGPGSGSNGWGPGSGSNGWGPGSHRYGWGVSRRHGWDAPISSPDGQVMILDLDHIYGESPTVGLQSLATPPNLPPWLTPVGQTYRFSSPAPLSGTLTIMFNYLGREVPNDREDRLWMAYSPDEGQTWQLLTPTIDTYHNLASAEMPGEGIYTLISTIDIPLSGPYWNVFSYLAVTQPVAEALASIDGYYTLVANYEASREPAWMFYDPTVLPQFTPLVNDLTHLEVELSYFVHVTESITLYLPGGGIENNLMEPAGLQLPPATFYGWITPTASFTPTVGMTMTSWIDGNLCGETTVEELDGQLAYKLQVMAENITGPPNGCGASEKNIVFKVGDSVMPSDHTWDNSHAWFHSLSGAEEQATVGSSVTLQGRPSPPEPRWSVPLSVTLTVLGESQPAYSLSVMTDENGTFTLTDIEPRTYEIAIKKSTTLQNIQLETLVAGNNSIHFGTLREGDANNDNFVSILDFSILAAAFSRCSDDPNFDPRADFNGDDCITIRDFSLLASNFGQGGDNFEAQPALPSRSPNADGASIAIHPASRSVATGELLTVTVRIDADNQQIDGAQASLNFDPSLLQVEQIKAGDALELELLNQFNNSNGTIDFAAGTLDHFPSGKIELLSIQLRALAPTATTALAFELSSSSGTDVTFSRASVLGAHTDANIIISQPTAVTLRSLATPTTQLPLWTLAVLVLTTLTSVWLVRWWVGGLVGRIGRFAQRIGGLAQRIGRLADW